VSSEKVSIKVFGKLKATDDYTIASTTLTFTIAPAASAEIVFRYLGS
jgi:hypothetical protein